MLLLRSLIRNLSGATNSFGASSYGAFALASSGPPLVHNGFMVPMISQSARKLAQTLGYKKHTHTHSSTKKHVHVLFVTVDGVVEILNIGS